MTYIPISGNNAKILHLIRDYFPNFYNINGYIEPLVGPGTVYFYLMENNMIALQGKPIYLSDKNGELINCHKMVRDSPDEVELAYEKHVKLHCEKHYYEVRGKYPPGNGMTNVEKAAAFIYLVRASYGHGWRVNSYGKMNVSFNDGLDSIMNSRNFRDDLDRYSRLLKFAHINTMSFENILRINGGKDRLKDYFVYLDQPFRNDKNTWSVIERLNLPRIFKELDKMGAKVMLETDDRQCRYTEYKDFEITPILINRNNCGKDKDTELVITNYKIVNKQKTIDESWG